MLSHGLPSGGPAILPLIGRGSLANQVTVRLAWRISQLKTNIDNFKSYTNIHTRSTEGLYARTRMDQV